MFKDFLKYDNPLLNDPLEEEQTGPIESLQVPVACFPCPSCV